MDPFAAFKNEVFRPLASVVMPGVVAIVPFVIIACNSLPDVRIFYVTQSSWFFAGVVGVGTVVGMLLEDVGSSIERGIDRCIDLEYLEGHDEVWMAYLSYGTTDTNGRRFLGSTVTRLKFINSLMPALLIFAAGIVTIHIQQGAWSSRSVLFFCLGAFLLLLWLFRTSTELSEVASTTRYCLLPPDLRPRTYNANASPVRRIRHFAYVVGEMISSRVGDIDLRGRFAIAVIPIALSIFFGLSKTNAQP